MDFIPTSKFVVTIVISGMVYFFFNIAANMVISIMDLGSGGVYMSAAIWLFTLIPAVIVFGSTLRYYMEQQKRSMR